MKKQVRLFIILTFLYLIQLPNLNAQEWDYQGNVVRKSTPNLASWNIKIDFVTPDVGYAWIGYINTNTNYLQTQEILQTKDGGNSWTLFDTTLLDFGNSSFAVMDFWSVDTGYYAYYFPNTIGYSINTYDEGNNWQYDTLYSNMPQGLNYTSTWMPKGFQIASDSVSFFLRPHGNDTLSVYRSTNYSQSYDSLVTLNNINDPNGIFQLEFIDDSTGFIIGGNGKVLKTSNSGNSWTQLSGFNAPKPVYHVSFPDSMTGFATAGNEIYKTTDGGQTWTGMTPSVINSGIGLTGIHFYDTNNGYVVGTKGTVLYSQDGGSTWTDISYADTSTHFYEVQIAGNQCYVTSDSLIVRSKIFTNQWTECLDITHYPRVVTEDYFNADFSSDSSMYLVGSNYRQNPSTINNFIYRTKDFGQTWDSLPPPSVFYHIIDVDFLDDSVGYASGLTYNFTTNSYNSVIFNTNDVGQNWNPTTFPGYGFHIHCIQFYDANNGLAIGDSSIVFRTNDGGQSWMTDTVGGIIYGGDIFYLNQDTVFASFSDSLIMRSADGGATWNTVLSSNASYIYEIFFIDDQTGFAVGYDGSSQSLLYKSTDGGQTWTNQNLTYTNEYFTGVGFIDDSTGYIVGNKGMLLESTDSGMTWTQIPSYINNNNQFMGNVELSNSKRRGVISGGNGQWMSYLKEFSIKGNIQQSNGLPLANSKVYVLKYDSVNQLVDLIDTSSTDVNGDFILKTPFNVAYVGTDPDSASYPNEIPTYFDSSLTINNATPIHLTYDTTFISYNTIAGVNPGGSGSIGGSVNSGGGNLMQQVFSGLKMILVDSAKNPVQYTFTDNNAQFNISNLQANNTTYKVWTDYPGVNNKIAPQVTLSSGSANQNNLFFILHPTYLELVIVTSSEDHPYAGLMSVYPNPVNGNDLYLDFSSESQQNIAISLVTLEGKECYSSTAQLHDGNNHLRIPFSDRSSGVYFLKIKGDKGIETFKVVRSNY